MLDLLFSRFDALAERYGLEKIKTIGDGYMVAGGVPDPRPDHAQTVVEMALAMEDAANIATRALGVIHVSAVTRALLGDRYGFECRGKIEIKGKGIMETYFLERQSRRNGLAIEGTSGQLRPEPVSAVGDRAAVATW